MLQLVVQGTRDVAGHNIYIIYISLYIFLRLAKESQFIPLQYVLYFIMVPVLVRKIFTFYMNDVLLFKCSIPGLKAKFPCS